MVTLVGQYRLQSLEPDRGRVFFEAVTVDPEPEIIVGGYQWAYNPATRLVARRPAAQYEAAPPASQ